MRTKRLTISGIYKIVNKLDQKYYVGGSKNIFGRWAKHRRQLKDGEHDNYLLQKAFAQDGKDNFELIVVEKDIPESSLLDVEQKYLDIAANERDRCYNIKFKSDYRTSLHTHENIAAHDSRMYYFHNDTEKFTGTRRDFKKYTGINDTSIHALINGFRESVSGWKCRGANYISRPKRSEYWGYKAIDPSGNELFFSHFPRFCSDNGFPLKQCSDRLGRKDLHYLGWTFEYVFKTPENEHLRPIFSKLRDEAVIRCKDTPLTEKRERGKRLAKEWKLRNNYRSPKRELDFISKLTQNIRRMIQKKIRGNLPLPLRDILGCDIVDLKIILESKFPEGSSWKDYRAGGLRMFLLQSSSNFDLRKEEDIKKCFHHSNLELRFGRPPKRGVS